MLHPASANGQVLIRVAQPGRIVYSELHEGLREGTPAADSVLAVTAAVPLLARVYAAPDSFGVPPRYGSRASDALLWIGTRGSVQTLLEARDRARSRGSYADPRLEGGGYDFLANDSSAVISRTGRWLTEWIGRLKE